jgi:hypothetical protein
LKRERKKKIKEKKIFVKLGIKVVVTKFIAN